MTASHRRAQCFDMDLQSAPCQHRAPELGVSPCCMQKAVAGVGYLGVMHPGLVDVIKRIICIPYCQPESANGVRQPQIVCNVACHLLHMLHNAIQL